MSGSFLFAVIIVLIIVVGLAVHQGWIVISDSTSPPGPVPVPVPVPVPAPAPMPAPIPAPVPVPQPVQPTAPYTRLGCFRDDGQDAGKPRSLPMYLGDLHPWNADICHQRAKANGAKYFGRQFDYQCYAGKEGYGVTPSTACNTSGGSGAWANEVYKINS